MSAWPFLFSAGYVRDYQFIVCPRRFADTAQLAAFRKLVGPLVGRHTGSAEVKASDDPLLGSIVLVYACLPARVRGTLAFDVSNREVCVVFGVVFDETETKHTDFISRARSIFESEKPLLLNHFEDFWDKRVPTEPLRLGPVEAVSAKAEPVTTSPLTFRTANDRITKAEPPTAKPSLDRPSPPHRQVVIAVSFVLLLASVVLNIKQSSHSNGLERQLTNLATELQSLNKDSSDLKNEVKRLTKENEGLRSRQP
jgi:hypothetical protein